ncbi:MAG: hypothetical protein SFV51_10125 [Bryobacteraceae bacterium]|nr:hypothetical protein [Bryobacteraceae bacterium]
MGDINFCSAGDYYDRLTGVPALAQRAMFRFDAVAPGLRLPTADKAGLTARIIRLVMGAGGRLAAAGLAIGDAGLFALRATLHQQIYGVGPIDLRVLGPVFALVAAVALAASLLPARRAASVHPAVTLNGQ